jgi:hypothetical protein
MPTTYSRQCNTCSKEYTGFGKFYCSPACQPRDYSPNPKKGADHYMWKGEKASYYAFHEWLRANFGKADRCESTTCSGKSKKYEYSILKGKQHGHNRENYWMLCKPCHMKYDEVHYGDKSSKWKGGKPKCVHCSKTLSTYTANRCRACIMKLDNPINYRYAAVSST